MYLTTINERWS